MKHFGVNRAILVGNFKQSKCCSEGSQLIRSEISIKLAKVSKICQNTPLLPVSLRLCPNSYLLRHFDLPLPDHDDTTAIASSRFHNRAKIPFWPRIAETSAEIAIFCLLSLQIGAYSVSRDNRGESERSKGDLRLVHRALHGYISHRTHHARPTEGFSVHRRPGISILPGPL